MRERCEAPSPLILHCFGPSRLMKLFVALVQCNWILSCPSKHYFKFVLAPCIGGVGEIG